MKKDVDHSQESRQQVILVAPSLDITRNVGGVAAVAYVLKTKNQAVDYLHFRQGLSDEQRQGWRRYLLTLLSFLRWLVFLCKHRKAVVHYNFPLSRNGILRDFWFIKVTRLLRRPMVVHLHGGLYLSEPNKPFPVKQMLKSIFSMKVPFIVLSEKEKRRLEEEYGEQQIHVLPNVVDTEDAARYERRNFEEQPLKVLYLGRIEKDKGMDYVLEAMKKLKERGTDCQLILAGREQGSHDYLRRFAEALGERFVYRGIVSGAEKETLLRECQVFLLPSFYEGLPMSLLETMSYGEVPVVTPVGSIGEVVEDRHNGLLVSVKDSDSIVSAIRQLSDDRQLMKTLSASARDTILRRFSTEEYMTHLNRLYQETKTKKGNKI